MHMVIVDKCMVAAFPSLCVSFVSVCDNLALLKLEVIVSP